MPMLLKNLWGKNHSAKDQTARANLKTKIEEKGIIDSKKIIQFNNLKILDAWALQFRIFSSLTESKKTMSLIIHVIQNHKKPPWSHHLKWKLIYPRVWEKTNATLNSKIQLSKTNLALQKVVMNYLSLLRLCDLNRKLRSQKSQKKIEIINSKRLLSGQNKRVIQVILKRRTSTWKKKLET